MEQEDSSIRMLPLSFLPKSSRDILSNLLNSTKVIPADGPDKKVFRDWRGLAALAEITSQVQANIHNCSDKTARVLDLWNDDPSVTVGMLLDNLELMDRYDAIEDVKEDLAVHLARRDKGIVNLQNQPGGSLVKIDDDDDDESEILTFDDFFGYCHIYDAYVLYAEQDQGFVDKLCGYLDSKGFKICTKDKLLPGQTTYPRVAKLISERCHRIILVYSPDFLNSPADSFFSDYAQAISIDSRKNKIIPIMFRDCHLPSHLAVYHNLRYNSGMYNFWEKLQMTIAISQMTRMRIKAPVPTPTPRIEISQAHSAVNIVEMSSSNQSYLNIEEGRLTQRSRSVDTVHTEHSSSPEDSIISDTSEVVKKKKPNKMRRFLKKLTVKKNRGVVEDISGL